MKVVSGAAVAAAVLLAAATAQEKTIVGSPKGDVLKGTARTAFDAAGATFLDIDHLHPNDAGHLAIARAFGGAVERAP